VRVQDGCNNNNNNNNKKEVHVYIDGWMVRDRNVSRGGQSRVSKMRTMMEPCEFRCCRKHTKQDLE
jgi:hypothetical protein